MPAKRATSLRKPTAKKSRKTRKPRSRLAKGDEASNLRAHPDVADPHALLQELLDLRQAAPPSPIGRGQG